jgi:hypothetical protein
VNNHKLPKKRKSDKVQKMTPPFKEESVCDKYLLPTDISSKDHAKLFSFKEESVCDKYLLPH